MTSTGGIQIRLGDLIYGILKRWKMILLLTFIGLVFGVLISAFTYMQGSYSNYQIDASFIVLTKNDEDNFTSYDTAFQHPNDYDFATDMVETVDYVIKSDTNMNRAIDSLKMIGIKPQDIAQNLDLTAYGSTPIVEATFTWRDAKEGTQILNAVLDAAQETLPERLKVGKLSVIDPPAARQSLAGTVGGSIWGYMTILGFLAGVGYVALEILMRPTLTNLSDMENVVGLESLGAIPLDKKYFREKKSLLVNDEVTSAAVTQNYASTAFILKNRLKPDKGPHCFYVTSTITGEGKTVVAANLAVQLSDMECRVLLIDMDSRNPTLGKLFLDYVDYDRSLNALYKGDATVLDSVYTLTGYLDLLPMVLDRQPLPMEGTVFDLIKEIEKNYDYVIIDTAPVGHYSDVLSLNAIADTVLFVVGYDSATIPEIITAVEKLDKSGIRILGSVVNKVQNLTGMTHNEESEDRKKHLLRDRKREPLAWEKAMGKKAKQEEKADKKAEKRKRKKEAQKSTSKQKKRFGKRKSKNQQDREIGENTTEKMSMPAVVDPADSSAEKPAKRNPLLDLMDEESKTGYSVISDNDARDALFKIGMDGDFGEEDLASETSDHVIFAMFKKEAGIDPAAALDSEDAFEAEANLETENANETETDFETGDANETEASDHVLFAMFKKEANLETRAESVAKPEAEAQSEIEPEPEEKANAEVKPEGKPETSNHVLCEMFKKNANLKTGAEPVAKPEAEAEAKSKAEAGIEPEGKTKAKAEVKPEGNSETSGQVLCEMFKKEAKAKAEAEAKAKAEAEAKEKAEAEAKARAEAEAKARAEAEAKEKAEAEAKARAEAEAKAKAEAEAKARAEAEAKIRAEVEAKLRAEAEEKARAETEAKIRAEVEAKIRAEMEAKARAEAEAKAKAEAEAKAKVEAEAKAKAEAEAKAKAEAEAKAKAEADDSEEDDYEYLRNSMRFFF